VFSEDIPEQTSRSIVTDAVQHHSSPRAGLCSNYFTFMVETNAETARIGKRAMSHLLKMMLTERGRFRVFPKHPKACQCACTVRFGVRSSSLRRKFTVTRSFSEGMSLDRRRRPASHGWTLPNCSSPWTLSSDELPRPGSAGGYCKGASTLQIELAQSPCFRRLREKLCGVICNFVFQIFKQLGKLCGVSAPLG